MKIKKIEVKNRVKKFKIQLDIGWKKYQLV